MTKELKILTRNIVVAIISPDKLRTSKKIGLETNISTHCFRHANALKVENTEAFSQDARNEML